MAEKNDQAQAHTVCMGINDNFIRHSEGVASKN